MANGFEPLASCGLRDEQVGGIDGAALGHVHVAGEGRLGVLCQVEPGDPERLGPGAVRTLPPDLGVRPVGRGDLEGAPVGERAAPASISRSLTPTSRSHAASNRRTSCSSAAGTSWTRWGGWGSNQRPADYEKHSPALRARYLHGYHGVVPPIALIAPLARVARSTSYHGDHRMSATERYRPPGRSTRTRWRKASRGEPNVANRRATRS
jgi:hypothetical protein